MLAQINEDGTLLGDRGYRDWGRAGLARGAVDKALNLLAKRGEIRLEPGRTGVVAVVVQEVAE